MQKLGSSDFIKKTKMGGQVANAAKKPKEDLIQCVHGDRTHTCALVRT